jgi:hypothetical protein
MVGIPPALDTDPEDVAWALQTAEALWKRNERGDAVVWLRRAAQAAGEADDDDRALALARDAAELADWLTRNPASVPARAVPSSKAPTAAEAVDDLLRSAEVEDDLDESDVEDVHDDDLAEVGHVAAAVDDEEVGLPEVVRADPAPPARAEPAPLQDDDGDSRDEDTGEIERIPLESERLDEPRTIPPPDAAAAEAHTRPPAESRFRSAFPTADYGDAGEDVRTAAETHAGMLDPWAEAESPTRAREAHRARERAASTFDRDEVVTSAPPVSRPDRAVVAKPGPVAPPPPRNERVDLSGVEALSDLPDEARTAFARAALVRDLARDEEVSGFALAFIMSGSLDLAATIVDATARRLETGAVVRSRGTVDHVAPIRLVAASGPARVATWDERSVVEAFRTCPWVEHELRATADRLHAEVGATMGPLGERLDPVLRAGVAARLALRILGEHEVFATRGKAIPGLLVVGAGELELVGDDGVTRGAPLRAGEFLFPSEVLRAAPAPSTVRAAAGGALILMAERGIAQELLVTCPPLLEIFAGG